MRVRRVCLGAASERDRLKHSLGPCLSCKCCRQHRLRPLAASRGSGAARICAAPVAAASHTVIGSCALHHARSYMDQWLQHLTLLLDVVPVIMHAPVRTIGCSISHRYWKLCTSSCTRLCGGRYRQNHPVVIQSMSHDSFASGIWLGFEVDGCVPVNDYIQHRQAKCKT
jgi:hypothetical protein